MTEGIVESLSLAFPVRCSDCFRERTGVTTEVLDTEEIAVDSGVSDGLTLPKSSSSSRTPSTAAVVNRSMNSRRGTRSIDASSSADDAIDVDAVWASTARRTTSSPSILHGTLQSNVTSSCGFSPCIWQNLKTRSARDLL